MALDVLLGGSESHQPRRPLCLLAAESQPHVNPRACSLLGNPATLAGWEGGSQVGDWLAPGVWEEPLLLAGLRPKGLCQPGLQEVPQGSQAPEVAVKAGLCPYKELWFEESRCPVGRVDGWDPHGS